MSSPSSHTQQLSVDQVVLGGGIAGLWVLNRLVSAGFETVFSAPLEPFPTDDDVADATMMNRAIEQSVAFHPAQYQWCYKRFKTRPSGAPKLY